MAADDLEDQADGLDELRGVWRVLAAGFPGLELVGLTGTERWEQDRLDQG